MQEVLDGAPDFGGQSEEREGKDGSGGNTRQRGRGRGRGRFDFEADDVRIQQVSDVVALTLHGHVGV